MSRKARAVEEKPAKVPGFIVTFSDMVTLLLTFFVMLLTLSNVRDHELYDIGRNSFLKSVSRFGLGMLVGKKPTQDFGEEKIKYFTKKPDALFDVRNIDTKEEELRRIFKKITRSMKTAPSQLVARKTNFSVTDISFSLGQADLNNKAKKFLTRFAADLQAVGGTKTVKLYVLGLARDAKGEKEQWILSARRAQAVSDFLGSVLPIGRQWPVYSWGAGHGGIWVSENSLASEQSQILIAVLRDEND